MPLGKSFEPSKVMPQWPEVIGDVEVIVRHGLDFSTLTFPDGTWSMHYDDGRITTFHADGSMDVIDPEDNHYAHHSATELAVDAIEIESAIRRTLGDADWEAER